MTCSLPLKRWRIGAASRSRRLVCLSRGDGLGFVRRGREALRRERSGGMVSLRKAGKRNNIIVARLRGLAAFHFLFRQGYGGRAATTVHDAGAFAMGVVSELSFGVQALFWVLPMGGEFGFGKTGRPRRLISCGFLRRAGRSGVLLPVLKRALNA
jgi:hypothetical protein